MALTAGSSELPKSKSNSLLRTRPPSGFLNSYRKNDSTTGLSMPKTGASPAIATGAIQSRSGCLMTAKKLSAAALSKSLRNCQARDRLLTSTGSTWITFKSRRSKAKECLRESPKYLIAGSNPALCPSLNRTILSLYQKPTFRRVSPPISSLKVLTRPVAGSTPLW